MAFQIAWEKKKKNHSQCFEFNLWINLLFYPVQKPKTNINEGGCAILGRKHLLKLKTAAWDDWFCDPFARQRWQQWRERTLSGSGECMVNRHWKSQVSGVYSVVIQSLYFSHIEPFWWSIDWETWKRQIRVYSLSVHRWIMFHTCQFTCN